MIGVTIIGLFLTPVFLRRDSRRREPPRGGAGRIAAPSAPAT